MRCSVARLRRRPLSSVGFGTLTFWGATMIRFACPVCNAIIRATVEQVGTKMPCPKCSQRLAIPSPATNKTVVGNLIPEKTAAPIPAPPATPVLPVAKPIGNPSVTTSSFRRPSRRQALLAAGIGGSFVLLVWIGLSARRGTDSEGAQGSSPIAKSDAPKTVDGGKTTSPDKESSKDKTKDKGILPQVDEYSKTLHQILYKARVAANKIAGDESGKAFILADVAYYFVKAGSASTPRDIADRYKDTTNYTQVLTKIALAHAEEGNSQAAEDTFRLMSKASDSERLEILARMCAALIDVGNRDKVQPLLQQAVKLSNAKPKPTDIERFQALAELVRVHAMLNDLKSARLTLKKIGTTPGGVNERLAFMRLANVAIVEAQAKAGDLTGAVKANMQMDPTSASWAFANGCIKIASAAASRGDVQFAMRCVDMISVPEQQVQALAEIAKHQFAAGKPLEAKETLSRAVTTAWATTNPLAKAMALRIVAVTRARVEDIEGALRLADQIQHVKDLDATGGDHGNRASAFAEVALVQFRAKDPSASQSIEKALKALQMQRNSRPRTYEFVSYAQAKIGNAQDAVEWSEKLDDPESRVYALLGAAKGLLETRSNGKR